MGHRRTLHLTIVRAALFLAASGVGMAWRDWLHPVKHIASLRSPDTLGSSLDLIPGLRSTPVPEVKPQARPTGDPDTATYGATGTPILGGFVTDLQEYNAEMRGRAALPIYEKMRRSDADCAAVLTASKLPILSAEHKIIPGAKENEPHYAQAKEEAAFVEDCLFGDLEYSNTNGVKFSQRWESVLQNALLTLDYGCAGSEDLWTIDGDRVRLSRIAPRLPLTFYRFHVDNDGETLRSVEQWGYRGANWVTVQVPADKFTLFSYRQEGANFYGRAMQREAYQHWYIKQALYRIDSIACERNAIGVPKIVMGPNPSPDDRAAANEWVQNLSAHEQTGLNLPNGWDMTIESVKGKPRDIMPSIQHHSSMIYASGLAQWMSLGTSQTGSRAVGNVLMDMFQLFEESIARFVCDTISQTTIRRLVDFNFPRSESDPVPYPRLVVPHIAVINPLDLFTALKDVADSKVDILQPDDDTENYLRKKVGLPQKSGQVRPRYAPVSVRVTETSEESPEDLQENPDGPIGSTGAQPKTGGAHAAGSATTRVRQTGNSKPTKPSPLAKAIQPKPAPVKLTELLTRELKPFEKKHNFAGHAKRQDQTQTAVRRILSSVKPALIRNAAQRAAVLDPKHLESMTIPFSNPLAARLTKAAAIAAEYGYTQVYAERKKATKRDASVRLADSADEDQPRLIAEAAVSDLHNWVGSRARGAHIDAYKRGLRDKALEGAIITDLLDGSDSMLDRIALETARSAVAGGRYSALQELASAGEIGKFVWSAAMDKNTCDPCQQLDGKEWNSFDEIDSSPGDTCDGNDACRCQIMPIFSDEGTVELE